MISFGFGIARYICTRVADQLDQLTVLRDARSMILHAWAPANVTKDHDLNRYGMVPFCIC